MAIKPPEPSTRASTWEPVDLKGLLGDSDRIEAWKRELEELVRDSLVGLEPVELRCRCGRPADSLHVWPRFGKGWPEALHMTPIAACPPWDPGGYGPIWLADFWSDLEGWGRHLAAKSATHWQALVDWLVEQPDPADAPDPLAGYPRRAHAGRAIFAGGPGGELVVLDGIRDRELYRGRLDLNRPYVRKDLAELLAEQLPPSAPLVPLTAADQRERLAEHRLRWLDRVGEACNALAQSETPLKSAGGRTLDELEELLKT